MRPLLLLSLALLLSAVPADAARPRPSCQTAGETLVANAALRVYDAGENVNGSTRRFMACRAGARRARYLVSDSGDSGVPPVAIGGRFAIFERRHCTDADDRHVDRASCSAWVGIYDARRDKIRVVRIARSADRVTPYALSHVVTARGWSAWVAVEVRDLDRQAVWIMPPGGRPRQIATTASGDYGAAFSGLAVNGDRLFWSIGDQTGSRLLH